MDLFNDLFNADDVNTLFGSDENKGGDLFASSESKKEEAAPKKEEAAPKKEEAAPKKEEAAPKKEEAAPKKEEAAPKKEEAAPKKEEAAPKKEEATKKETSKKEESSKASSSKETKSKTKKTDQEKLRVNPTWTIAYAAQIYTPPEVDMTLEDVRKFMEQDYPEFSNSRTKWDVDEEKMLLVPIIHGGKMG